MVSKKLELVTEALDGQAGSSMQAEQEDRGRGHGEREGERVEREKTTQRDRGDQLLGGNRVVVYCTARHSFWH